MKKRIYLIDIDGTVCEDIPNEESHRFRDAYQLTGALEEIVRLHSTGNRIIFFTAREEKDRAVTLDWLTRHGFPFESLIMDKPRCIEPDDEYVWIDNRPVRAVTYKGEWSSLKETRNSWISTGTFLSFSKP